MAPWTTRALTLDASGTACAGTVTVPPSRFWTAFFRFSDEAMSGIAAVRLLHLGNTDTIAGPQSVSNTTPDIDLTGITAHPVPGGMIQVDINSLPGGSPGDTIDVTLVFEV